MSEPGTTETSSQNTTVELILRGDPPVLERIKFTEPGRPPADTGRLQRRKLPKAVAIILTMLRAHSGLALFRVHSSKKKGCFVRTILNAMNDAQSKSPIHGLANGRFLRLFLKPTGSQPDYLDVDLAGLQPENITVKLDGRDVAGGEQLKALSQKNTTKTNWELADYRFEINWAAAASLTAKPAQSTTPPEEKIPDTMQPAALGEAVEESLLRTPSTPGPQQPTGDAPAASQPHTHPTIDNRLLSDYLTGVGFAQWLGSEDEWIKTIRVGKEWLKSNPEDLYSRAMLAWAILCRGTPEEMLGVLKETVEWLQWPISNPHSPSSKEVEKVTADLRREVEKQIARLAAKTVKDAYFVRRHLEDTLVRTAFLRYLISLGRTDSTWLAREARPFIAEFDGAVLIEDMVALGQLQPGDAWVKGALNCTLKPLETGREDWLARVCWLWLTGRQASDELRPTGRRTLDEQMHEALEQICAWLEARPNRPLVRWTSVWLAGLCREHDSMVPRVIDETAKWLDTTHAKNDPWLRHGFLWLVGDRGREDQVARAIEQTETWLNEHHEDDFIRIAYLLFVIRRNERKGAFERRVKVIAETRKWLGKHRRDDYGLTGLALRLCESGPNPAQMF